MNTRIHWEDSTHAQSVSDAGHAREMDVAQCPPRVMLHSYGGSADTLRAFLKLPTVGSRFYFSFSHVINADKEKHTPTKLLERLRAVPDDRLLLESDQSSALDIDPGARKHHAMPRRSEEGT
jgi:Tat protein secretion system quality control protein TatD with DNase activity